MHSPPPNSSPLLHLDQVSLVISTPIQEQWLLRQISFEVYPGDRIALVGPSGAGKSSLLRLLNRLSDPTEGSIVLQGQKLSQWNVLPLRQQVVLLLQESKLLGMTVQQALIYPLKLQGLKSSQIQSRLEEWITRLHIPSEWLGKTEVELSVGQRQWVSLARALMLRPKILLLDEPTASLDTGKATYLIDLLIQVNQQDQTTILMANHQLEWAQRFCTRLLYLHQGELRHNSAAETIGWENLHQELLQAEIQTAEEWS